MKYLTDFTIPLSLLDRQEIADSQHSPHSSMGQLVLCDGDVYRLRCVPQPVADGPETQKVAERVVVESQAYRAALDLVPQNEEQARKVKAILDRGPTYESCAFFQRRSSV